MKRRTSQFVVALMVVAGVMLAGAAHAQSLFTYQGQLKSGGDPFNGMVDVTVRLFGVASGGTELASNFFQNVEVADGLLIVELDFGSGQFMGANRWIEFEVNGQTLIPRQPVRPAPYAMYSLSAASSAQWASSGNAITNQNTGFVGINRDYTVGQEWFGVHAPVNSGYGGMYVTTEGATALPFYGYKAGNQAAWSYLDGSTGDYHINVDGNRLTITDEGMVGIRTSTPSYPLHVVSTNTDRTIFASNSAPTGAAIRGHASHLTGANYGLYGETDSTGGTAVYGDAVATSGNTFGGQFKNHSTSGGGMASLALSATGTTWGGVFQNVAPGGGGVSGFAGNASGNTAGVFGHSLSPAGSGVLGTCNGNGTGASGVRGEISHSGSPGAGVFGKAPFFGVVGHSVSGGAGVTGMALAFGNGVVGEAGMSNSAGVRGVNTSVSGTSYGVQGVATSASGYAGHFTGRGYFSGNVGIGTESPASLLSVAGGADITGQVSIGVTGADARLLVRGVLGEDAFRVRVEGSTKLLVKDNGGLGIGQNFSVVPANGLRTVGPAGIGADPGAFMFVSNGDAAKPGGGSWSSFSDARLKRNIQPLARGMLDRLLSLRGYQFEYINDAIESRLGLPGVQRGLIAQDVAEVFPEWVGEDEEGFLYITERGQTAIVVEALREMRSEKDAEIHALQQRIADLEQLVQHLIDSKKGRNE